MSKSILESKSENKLFYQISVIFIWFFPTGCLSLVIIFVIKLYAHNSTLF